MGSATVARDAAGSISKLMVPATTDAGANCPLYSPLDSLAGGPIEREQMELKIEAHVGAIFVPVRNIEAARDWYCRLLGIEVRGEIHFGHIYVVPMRRGSGLVLDSKDFSGPHDKKPLFHFMTRDIAGAATFLEALGIDHGGIRDGIFVTFKDPDGNLLMVADVPLPPTEQ
jgi:catechol 2,3-dioxygenase-like lactoylglutathione lyase family enzyme